MAKSQSPATFEARMLRKGPFSVEVADAPEAPGETRPRRNFQTPETLVTEPAPGIKTVWDLVRYGATTYGDQHAMGSRKLIKKHVETKKIKKVVEGKTVEVDKDWTYYELSGYSYVTYQQYESLVVQLGAGLRHLGLEAHDRLHIYAATRYAFDIRTDMKANPSSMRWLAMAHGAMSQSMSIVTAYETLGEEGLRHSLAATKAKAIYLEYDLLPMLKKCLDAAKNISFIIVNDINGETIPSSSEPGQPRILSFTEFQKLGEAHPTPVNPPKPDDLACIMYTSGSAGTPKGVRILHKGIVAAVAGAGVIVGEHFSTTDVLLAYLPLAHIFEFTFETAMLFWGTTLGYGSPKTLASVSCRSCKGDIQELRPTILIGVPAVWEMVKKGVMNNVNNANIVARSLFWGGLAAKKFLLSHNLPGAGLLDAVVFKKVKEATGGRLRACMNGAAAISKETQEFISYAIVPMVAGYGMTETNAMGYLGDLWAWNTEAYSISACLEVKLVDYAEAGYLTSRKPPQGEIWLRGPAIMDGYYNDEKLTAEVITSDGWFKTADIGEFTEDGRLKVIDRCKNLVKTLNGEYIAIEKLESVYISVPVVANICIYASPTETHAIAIVVLAEPALLKLAASMGVTSSVGVNGLANDEKIQSEVLRQLQTTGKKAGLTSLEIVRGVVCTDEEWLPANGLVTPTMKLNRKAIQERYAKQIDRAYGR